jgi:D-threo-aldose 1-dehydrogenase
VSSLRNESFPQIALGTGAWNSPFPAIPEQQAVDLTHYILQDGADRAGQRGFFDTAPLYGRGLSEQWVGDALSGYPRSAFIVSTKAGYELGGPGWPKHNLTRDGIFRSFEASLKRLRLEQVDILHLHDPDCCLEDALNISFPALAELRSQGLIRAVGAGMNQAPMLLEFARHADVDCFLLAGRYTLLDQTALPLLDYCQQKGIAIFLGSVYATGILATGAVEGARYIYRPASEEILARVRAMEALCAEYAIPLRAAALQFALAHPAVRSLVVGGQSITEWEDNKTMLGVQIPSAFWEKLKSQKLIKPDAPLPG